MFLEHIDKQPPDDFAFGFGIGLAVQFPQKQLLFIRVDQLHVIVIAEHFDHLRGFIFAQQPVVDKHAGELITNGLMDQNGGNRAVHSARKAANNLFVTNLRTDRRNGFFAIGAHGPIALKSSKLYKVFIKPGPVWSVMDLRVKLHCKKLPLGIGRDCKWRIGRGAENFKPGGNGADVITMRHPDLLAVGFEPSL